MMLHQPPPQALLKAMAALGWRQPDAAADARAEIAALDKASALRPADARRTTIDDIRHRIAQRDRLAEAPPEPLELPNDEVEFAREAARADAGEEKPQLSDEILERMQRDQERANQQKDNPKR
jgi:hypothetical protein